MNINSILTSFWSSVKTYLGNNYLGKTAKAESAKSADSVAWGNVSGKPSSYTPSSHTHSEYLTSITKSMVTTALGYTPPTSDTNTTYSAGSNITLTGTTFSLTKANVVGALGYTPPTSDTNTWTALKGSTTSAAGTAGYAPAPAAGAANRYLRCDGTWQVPPDTNTVYTLPTASSTLGGVKTTSTVTSTSGLTACPIISGVPYYKDTNTWTKMTAATASADGAAGYVPAPAAGKQAYMLRGNGTWTEPGSCIINNLAATTSAGITSHAVGTICLCFCNKGLAVGNGKTVSGAYLFPLGFYFSGYNGHTTSASGINANTMSICWGLAANDGMPATESLQNGTWKYLGRANGTNHGPAGLFVRVS